MADEATAKYKGTVKMIETWGLKYLSDGALRRSLTVLEEAGDKHRHKMAQREMDRRIKAGEIL